MAALPPRRLVASETGANQVREDTAVQDSLELGLLPRVNALGGLVNAAKDGLLALSVYVRLGVLAEDDGGGGLDEVVGPPSAAPSAGHRRPAAAGVHDVRHALDSLFVREVDTATLKAWMGHAKREAHDDPYLHAKPRHTDVAEPGRAVSGGTGAECAQRSHRVVSG
jgi:hypothetical protein